MTFQGMWAQTSACEDGPGESGIQAQPTLYDILSKRVIIDNNSIKTQGLIFVAAYYTQSEDP